MSGESSAVPSEVPAIAAAPGRPLQIRLRVRSSATSGAAVKAANKATIPNATPTNTVPLSRRAPHSCKPSVVGDILPTFGSNG